LISIINALGELISICKDSDIIVKSSELTIILKSDSPVEFGMVSNPKNPVIDSRCRALIDIIYTSINEISIKKEMYNLVPYVNYFKAIWHGR
jgi:hypothetical protein